MVPPLAELLQSGCGPASAIQRGALALLAAPAGAGDGLSKSWGEEAAATRLSPVFRIVPSGGDGLTLPILVKN